jgi:histone deacetylase 11
MMLYQNYPQPANNQQILPLLMTPQKIEPTIVYSPEYDIHFFGMEKLHPFDSRKYSRAWNAVKEDFPDELARRTLAPEGPASLDELQLVHTAEYLESLKSVHYVARVLELPFLAAMPFKLIESRVLVPMRLATAGTVLAAQQALDKGLAVNLSGGYHHASRDRGEGFCAYSDIAVAIEKLRRADQLRHGEDQVLIIDLDVHQGNGHERIFHDDTDVFIFDIYNQGIYPHDREAMQYIDWHYPLPAGTGDKDYLDILKDNLPQAIDFMKTEANPRLVIYIAGTDIYEDDMLGQFRVSAKGIFERDQFVFRQLVEAGIPVVMLPGGGYSKESYRFIASTIANVLTIWGDRAR